MKPTRKRSTKKMTELSNERKAAMAAGRAASAAVDAYLKHVGKPGRRGPRLSPEKLQERLAAAHEALADAEPGIAQLNAAQAVANIQGQLDSLEAAPDVDGDALEATFIEHASRYATSKGIDRATFRQCGVPAKVLNAAGIKA